MITLLPLLAWLLLPLLAICLLDLLAHARRDLPPGPRPLPVIGSLHLLGKLPHRSLARLAETHGPLLSLRLGAVTTVVVSSSDVAREIMQRHDATFAAPSVPDARRHHARNSVPWLPQYRRWRALRRIITGELLAPHRLDELQHLRREKVRDLVGHVRSLAREGVAVDVNRVALTTSLNLISRTIFSCDVTELDDHGRSKEFKGVVGEIMEVAGRPNLSDFFPAIPAADLMGYRRRMGKLFARLHGMFNNVIDQRLDGREAGDQARTNDLLDHLLDAALGENGTAALDRGTLLSMFMYRLAFQKFGNVEVETIVEETGADINSLECADHRAQGNDARDVEVETIAEETGADINSLEHADHQAQGLQQGMEVLCVAAPSVSIIVASLSKFEQYRMHATDMDTNKLM